MGSYAFWECFGLKPFEIFFPKEMSRFFFFERPEITEGGKGTLLNNVKNQALKEKGNKDYII